MSYVAIHAHNTYSLLDGYGDPIKHIKRAKKLGYSALGTTNHGNIFGHIKHFEACKKADIKPILGTEAYISWQPAHIKSNENRKLTHQVIWAKNKEGWKNLCEFISKTNDSDYFYYRPRIYMFDIEEDGKLYPGLETYAKRGGLQSFSGHQGSALSDLLFADLFSGKPEEYKKLKFAYSGKEKDYAKLLRPGWLEEVSNVALRIEEMFGKGNFWIELQNEYDPADKTPCEIHPFLVDCLRQVSKATGITSVASSDPHYPAKEDAEIQRILVSVATKETEESIQIKMEETDNDVLGFFGSDSFYLKSSEEMLEKFTAEEVEESQRIADQVEEFTLFENPMIPNYELDDDTAEMVKSLPYSDGKRINDDYLRYLCVEGAKEKKPWEINAKHSKEEYWQRLKDEWQVIFEIGLTDYFLIVWDICQFADNKPADGSYDWRENLKKNGNIKAIPRGIGRGSAAGCLISYLTGITGIDPVKYDLMFSRFYNKGRIKDGYVAMPDIDLDFGIEGKEDVIEYLRWKYGQDRVGPIVTFQTMKGKAAIKDVFRVKGVEHGYEMANDLSQFIEEESIIADEIEEIRKESDEDYNILKWTIDHSDGFNKAIEKYGVKPFIDLAVRCEGTKRSQGKHPSGIVVSSEPLHKIFPMVYDTRTKNAVVGFDMKDSEKLGAVKFDILGVAILSKLQYAQELARKNNEQGTE